jgi:hypothetical protein
MQKSFILVLFLAVCLSACKKENISSENEFNKSYKTWIAYKASVNNSYSYTQITSSFSGYNTEKKTGVSNGKIISRDFYLFEYNPSTSDKTVADKIILREWHEDANSINTHPNDAREALTLDDVYQKARTVWLKADVKANTVYFESKNNGLISSCGSVPIGCQDDCFNGIIITAITAL